VAHFVGRSNFLMGHVRGDKVETAVGAFSYKQQSNQDTDFIAEGLLVKVLIRPEYIVLNNESGSRATLVTREFLGGYYLYSLQLQNGETVQALLPSLANYQLGETIGITLSTDKVSIFEND